MKHILVTGSTGQIGSELVLELSSKYGRDNVVAAGHARTPDQRLASSAVYKSLDITDKSSLSKLVEKYDIDTVYHLAAILSATGEKDPSLAWHVNADGLYNILAVAREHGIIRIFWPSSIAVFGPNAPRVNTPQEAPLNPSTMYGVTKVAGELLCNYHHTKYGLDVRSVRYPGIISSETLPSGGTTDYAVEMFYEAVKKKRYTCFVRKDTVLPLLYMPDCISAASSLMDADPSRIKVRTSYNLDGMSFSAEQLANEIKKHIPGFVVDYKPDFRQAIADSWPMSIDGSIAKKGWNWKPAYDLASMTKDMVAKLSKRLLDRSR